MPLKYCANTSVHPIVLNQFKEISKISRIIFSMKPNCSGVHVYTVLGEWFCRNRLECPHWHWTLIKRPNTMKSRLSELAKYLASLQKSRQVSCASYSKSLKSVEIPDLGKNQKGTHEAHGFHIDYLVFNILYLPGVICI